MKKEEIDAMDARFEREFRQLCISLPILLIVGIAAFAWIISKVPT